MEKEMTIEEMTAKLYELTERMRVAAENIGLIPNHDDELLEDIDHKEV